MDINEEGSLGDYCPPMGGDGWTLPLFPLPIHQYQDLQQQLEDVSMLFFRSISLVISGQPLNPSHFDSEDNSFQYFSHINGPSPTAITPYNLGYYQRSN